MSLETFASPICAQIVAFGGRFEWAADPSYGDEGKTVAGEVAGSLDMSDIAKGSYFIGRLSNMDIKSLMQLVLPKKVYDSFKLPEWLATCGFPGDMEMSYSFAATTTPTGMRALYSRFMHHLAPPK